jgi:anti-anti-sigma factor
MRTEHTQEQGSGMEPKCFHHFIEDQNIRTEELPGVFCAGIQYYDLKEIDFINNTGLASFVDLLKNLLKQGRELVLVNVNRDIKQRIEALGLDQVLKCV